MTLARAASVEKTLKRDLTEMVTGVQGSCYGWILTDHYSSIVKLYPLKSKCSEKVVEAFSQDIMDFGHPTSVLTDIGGEFTSQAFHIFCKYYHMTVPHHPLSPAKEWYNWTNSLHIEKSVSMFVSETYAELFESFSHSWVPDELLSGHHYWPDPLFCFLFLTPTASDGQLPA